MLLPAWIDISEPATIGNSDNADITLHSKTLDKFTIPCHNPYEVSSNQPRLTQTASLSPPRLKIDPTAKLNQEERK